MAGLFNLPTSRNTKSGDKSLTSKTKKASSVSTVKGGGGSLAERIGAIKSLVESRLGKYKNDYTVISTEDDLNYYIEACLKNGIVSIDTETTGLNPLLDKVVGICLYTPGEKACYIPIRHISYIKRTPAKHQLPLDVVTSAMKKLADSGVKTVWHHAKFDIKFLQWDLGVRFSPYWDTQIAARILNENETSNSLKPLHVKYCTDEEKDEFDTFDKLFHGITFDLVPISTGYIYAARDAILTYELYMFQKQFLDGELTEERGLTKVGKVFREIEMPLIDVLADMEMLGIAFDNNYAKQLSDKYTPQLREIESEFAQECSKYQSEIDTYRWRNPGSLEGDISISSNKQLAILLYDIIGITPVNKDKPRAVGVDELTPIKHDIVKIILEHRKISKLLSTYIDKLPREVNPNTGRIHAQFNQMGADTGRMSSNDPKPYWGRKTG